MIFGLTKKRLKIVKIGNPTLNKPSEPINKITPEIELLGKKMLTTMEAANGLGLAGPQVGINKCIIALAIPFSKKADTTQLSPGENKLLPMMPLVLINPKIISFSPETDCKEEGCLSIPDIYADVVRSKKIMLNAQVLGGENIMVECGGLLARAIQHELDHLEGVLFTDRLKPAELKKIAPKLKQLKNKH